MNRSILILLTACLLVLLATSGLRLPTIDVPSFGFIGPEPEISRHLFLGDVMLARYVETLMVAKGSAYPFVGLESLQERYDTIIGNFEAAIPLVHEPTLPHTMRFSVATATVLVLSEYFDIVSLANNHTFDADAQGLAHTRSVLASSSVGVVGDPLSVNAHTVRYLDHHGTNVALIALNALVPLDRAALSALLAHAQTQSQMQVAYVHWGKEYEETHEPAQEELAHWLIDNGIDTVIGHHPHVIQNVAMYRGAPIFYSLGNFVFDQYFSPEVMVGLGVELTIADGAVSYRLIPFTTNDSPSSPRLMSYDERELLLADLAARSDPSLGPALASEGVIRIGTPLASL